MTDLETLLRETLTERTSELPHSVPIDSVVINRARRRRSQHLLAGLVTAVALAVVVIGGGRALSSGSSPTHPQATGSAGNARVIAVGQRFPTGVPSGPAS